MSRLFLHSAVPDRVPLLQNIHHPEEGCQQEEADQERELQEKWNKTGVFPSSFFMPNTVEHGADVTRLKNL